MYEKIFCSAVFEIDTEVASVLRGQDIARSVGVSRRHLDRAFGEIQGIIVTEYLRVRRLQLAAARLAEGWKVEAAALASGFQSRRHFYRMFKRRFGVTPAAFRNRAPRQLGP